MVLRLEPYQLGDWPDGRERRSRQEGGPGRGVVAQNVHGRAAERPPRGQQGSLAGIEGKS